MLVERSCELARRYLGISMSDIDLAKV